MFPHAEMYEGFFYRGGRTNPRKYTGGNTHAKQQKRNPNYKGKEDKFHDKEDHKRPFEGQKCTGKPEWRLDDRLVDRGVNRCVVGAVFMALYQGSITTIWNSIVSKITGLLS